MMSGSVWTAGWAITILGGRAVLRTAFTGLSVDVTHGEGRRFRVRRRPGAGSRVGVAPRAERKVSPMS